MELIGNILGNYRVVRLLADGSTGTVYQAYDHSLKRDVAIKVFHNHVVRQPKSRELFLRARQEAVEHDHPGFVKVYDFDVHVDQLYIVMEYIRGANLRQLMDSLIQERGWLLLSEAILLMEQLCQTLEYAHQHGMLHRDIKPANLMLKPEPVRGLPFRVVLTDLGLAETLAGQEMIPEKAYLETAAYMSPEQASGLEAGPASYVYSLGVLLYELAVGLLPFSIKTGTDAARYHTQEPPRPPRSIRPELPEALEQIILKALEKDPADRYPSPAGLGTALAEMIGDAVDIADLDSGQGVSLLKKYEESLVSPLDSKEPTDLVKKVDLDQTQLRPSPAPAPTAIPPKIPFSIEVLTRGREPQVITLQAKTATIGRDQDNQLVIIDPEISRQHAQLTWDGLNFFVTDLNSRNGTYLGNRRLQADNPQVWRPDQELRIGETVLRLVRQAQPGAVETYGAVQIGALVTPQQLTAEAGENVTANISLINLGQNVDYFSLSLTGVPNGWVSSLPSPVEVLPGKQKEIVLNLQVPRTFQSRAGRHSISIKVSSQRDPRQFVELKLALTVAAFSEFKAELQPERLRPGQPGRITISNLGNLQETFDVQFIDHARELNFQPPRVQLRVPAGQSASADFQSGLRQQRWLGGEKSHPFSAQVSLPKGVSQTLPGEMLSQGLLPIWVIPAVVLFCLLFTGSAAALFGIVRSGPTVTPTPNLTLTLSVTPEPGAPTVKEWCVFPSDKVPASFIDCPFQVRAAPRQTLIIQWNVSDADEVIIEPIGNQPPSGRISYEVTENTTAITLRARKADKDIEKRVDIIVVPLTATPTNSPTNTSTSTSTSTQTHTPTITHTSSPTSSATATQTNSPTPTSSQTPTVTYTSSPTATFTRTPTPTPTTTLGSP